MSKFVTSTKHIGFSPLQDRRQFPQRYYEYLDEFRSPDGPIFLKICGESVCNGISNDYLGVSLQSMRTSGDIFQ